MALLKPEEAATISSQEAEAQAAFEAQEAERAFNLREQERAGLIRRQPFETTGIGGAIGGVGGALIGTAIGHPILGALGGTALGEAGEQLVHQATATGSGESIPPQERAVGMATSLGFAAAGEFAGLGLRLVRPTRYVQARPLTPEQVTRKATLDKFNVPYLPAEITDNGLQRFITDIGEFGIFSPPGFKVLRERQEHFQKRALKMFTDSIGTNMDPSDLGQSFAWLVNHDRDVATANASAMYNGIKNALHYTVQDVQIPSGQMIPHPNGLVGANGQVMMVPQTVTKSVTQGGLLTDISKSAQLFRPQLEELARTAKTAPDVAKLLKQRPFYEVAQEYALGDDLIQWNEAHDLLKAVRSDIRDINSLTATGGKTPSRQKLGTLLAIETQLEKDLAGALQNSTDPQHRALLSLWDGAQAFVKERAETLRNDTVQQLVRTVTEHGGEPGVAKFVSSLSPDDIQKVLKATNSDPFIQDSLRNAFVMNKIELAGGKEGKPGLIDTKQLRDLLFGKSELTARKIEVLLTPQQQHDLRTLVDAIEQQQAQMKPGKFGSMFMAMRTSGATFTIPSATIGALFGVGMVNAPAATLGTSLAVVVGPRMVGNWLLKPETAQLMIRGVRAGRVGQTSVIRGLMQHDKEFARLVQGALSAALVSTQEGGPPKRTAESTTLEAFRALPSAFPQEK